VPLRPIWVKFRTDVHKSNPVDCQSCSNRVSENHTAHGHESVGTFDMYSPIWVKISVKDLHLMLSSIYEIREIRANTRREACSFVIGVREITFARVS
jgi:hypothetical protein